MLKSKNKIIAITMGDPQGIGLEVICKALKVKDIVSSGRFIIIGNRRLITHRLKTKHKHISIIDIPYQTPAEGSLKFLNQGIYLIQNGLADALVTAPLCKERVAHYYKGFKGHTEYLAEAVNAKHVEMMFVAKTTRTVIVTRHVPIKNVSSLITQKSVFETIKTTHAALNEIFKIKNPSIAVLGLNPHAGENGLIGGDEKQAIIPAIKQGLKFGWNIKGPFPADTFFAGQLRQAKRKGTMYDAVIAMYHDQGLIPIKTLYSDSLVNMTIGLPFIRTCPAHGTAFDIAGKNIADPSSMISSIKLACELIRKP